MFTAGDTQVEFNENESLSSKKAHTRTHFHADKQQKKGKRERVAGKKGHF